MLVICKKATNGMGLSESVRLRAHRSIVFRRTTQNYCAVIVADYNHSAEEVMYHTPCPRFKMFRSNRSLGAFHLRCTTYQQGSPPRVVDTDNRRIDLLDVSDNGNFVGEVPASYSELLILFADNTGLSGLDLPDFIDATTTTAAGAWNEKSTLHDLFLCPAFKPSADENVAAVTLDHAYDGYSVCTCNDG